MMMIMMAIRKNASYCLGHSSVLVCLFGLVVWFTLLSPSMLVSGHTRRLSQREIVQYREKVRSMFNYAYESYLTHASSFDELMPLSCDGMNTWGTFSLSLIDALSTLAIMGNHSEFQRVAEYLVQTARFDHDRNVSVFETNIRVVGGLLSAHLLSKRAGMVVEEGWPCSGPLLRLAENVARRLLPAFETATGMPYGTVNLVHGVPSGETPVTCTAGVGTFIVEFATLSRLTGDPVFEQKALQALDGLQRVRSKIGLLGNHVNVQEGKWIATDAGIGAGVDSYFEYLVKGAMLIKNPVLMEVFHYDYDLIKTYFLKSDWYVWASMTTGQPTLPYFQNLEAFFPGILTLMGDIDQAKKSLYNYHQIWKEYGFVPEFYDIANQKLHKREGYPLRPEYIESILYLYRATRDPHLLQMGIEAIESIEHSARTDCGYATVSKVSDHTLEDRMESFFLAETLKYLYLLFDEDSFIHNNGQTGEVVHFRRPNSNEFGSCVIGAGGYVFNTEAHPIDIGAVECCHNSEFDYQDEFDAMINLFDLLQLKNPNSIRFENLKFEDSQEEFEDQVTKTKSFSSSSSPSASLETFSNPSTTSGSNPTTTERVIDKTIEPSFTESTLSNYSSTDSNFESKESSTSTTTVHSASKTFESSVPLAIQSSTTTVSSNSNSNARNLTVILKPTVPIENLTNYLEELRRITQSVRNDNPNSSQESSQKTSELVSNLTHEEEVMKEALKEEEEEESGKDQQPTPLNYELLACSSQSFLSRLSLQGQMFFD